MRTRADKNHPSPVLTGEQVRAILIERNAELGGAGGALGGQAGGGPAGRRGGASGGRMGGRLGARLFTRLTGLTSALAVPCRDDAVARVREVLRPLPYPYASALPESTSPRVLGGLVGAGAFGMNTAVVQVVWYPGRAEVTAHAFEGIVDQRTAAGAITTLDDALAPFRRIG